MAQPDTPRSDRRLVKAKGRIVVPALCLLTVTALGLWFTLRAAAGYAQNIGAFHDDGIYVACAQSIASGLGYRIISLPMEPFQTKYPPLFPLTLSTAWLAEPDFPKNVPLLEGVTVFSGLQFLFACGAYLVWSGRATPLLSIAVLGITWLNLNFLSFLPAPMAELQSAALAVAALCLCEATHSRRGRSPKGAIGAPLSSWLLVGLLFAASALSHVMGCFATAAAGIYLTVHGNFRGLAALSASFLVLVAPSWIWAGLNSYTSPPALVYYTNYLLAARSTAQQGALPVFVARNISTGFVEVMDTVIQPLKTLSPELLAAGSPALILYAIPWLVLAAGVASELILKRHANLLAIWILLHGSLHLLWPRGVGMRRLLIALPFIYYFLFRGLRFIGAGLKRELYASKDCRSWRQPFRLGSAAVSLALTAFLLGGNLAQTASFAGSYAHRVPPPPQAGADYSESSEFNEAYDWIRNNTASDAVLIWNNDPAAYLWTGRKAMAASIGESFGVSVYPDALITSEDLLASIRLAGGDYLVIDPVSVGGLAGFNQIGGAVEVLMHRFPGALAPAFTSKFGLVTIFKIDRSKLGRAALSSPS